MNKKESNHLNLGGASILLVLMIFSLTVFAVLSFRDSYQELILAQKNKKAVEYYYIADSKAEEYLQTLHDAAKELAADNQKIDADNLSKQIGNDTGITLTQEGNCLTFLVKVDYNMTLEVKIDCPKKDEKRINVTSWKVISNDSES